MSTVGLNDRKSSPNYEHANKQIRSTQGIL